jgi:hypothetical protein
VMLINAQTSGNGLPALVASIVARVGLTSLTLAAIAFMITARSVPLYAVAQPVQSSMYYSVSVQVCVELDCHIL